MLLQCLSTGAIFTSLCAALVVPPLTWLSARALSPSISAMQNDRRWQANVSAAAAALPGALFLVLVSFGIAGGANSPCLQLVAGKIVYGLLAGLFAGAIVRSLLRAHGRRAELQALLGDALPVHGHAAAIASEVGIVLYEVRDDHEIVLMVASAPRPGAYISTAALHQFDEAELRAALFHERAHLERGDHRIAPWLYFLTDLLPLPASDLINIYRCSREFCADRCALSHVPRTDLASALLRVARSSAPSPLRTVAAFAECDAMYGRLDLLLRPKADLPPELRRRVLVTVSLSLIFALGVAMPVIATSFLHCQSLGLFT